MHFIAEPSTNYAALDLRCSAVEERLSRHLPRVKRFYATASVGFHGRDPMGSYDENAICFGFDNECFIKIEPSGDLVERIWFEIAARDGGELAALRAAFLEIDKLHPSIIADYWLQEAGAVADPAFLNGYFSEFSLEK